MAKLEGGEEGMAFSSGSAALHALFSVLEVGDHLLLPKDVYHGSRSLLNEVMLRQGIRYTEVDFRQVEEVRNAIEEKTKMALLESPSNPLLQITDFEMIIPVLKKHGCYVAVDNTWPTPLITQPIAYGADVVVHSVTKYLSGHSDVVAGALVFADSEHDYCQKARMVQFKVGAVMDPFSAWLTMRGMRSMEVRLRRQCENALALAEWLQLQNKVLEVFYPGLEGHSGAAIASKQMLWPGAMLSFLLDSDAAGCIGAVGRSRIFKRATSLGGTESLIEHRASVEAQPTATPQNLIRVSVGLESIDHLIEDMGRVIGAK
jgi:cystathionine gamma-synthase